MDTVAQALLVFEAEALQKRQWRADGGASLATYFIGTCIYAFADIYRRRIQEWERDLAVKQALACGPLPDMPDIADEVTSRDAVVRFISAAPPRSTAPAGDSPQFRRLHPQGDRGRTR